MYTASQKRKDNIAEYLLYMWQVEDMIRANDLDIDRIKANIIDKYTDLSDAQRKELTDWYESLIDMMRREGVAEKGHLQINRNVLADLVRLHQALLKDPRFADYTAEFYRTLPFIVELRAKAGHEAAGEIETCFNALYGMLMLRLGGKELTPATLQACQQIVQFINVLSKDYHLDELNKLFTDDDDNPTAASH